MELNPCENGSVKVEINHQEQTLIRSLECLNLETNEGSRNVSTDNHIAEDLAGKYMHQRLSEIVTFLNVNGGRCRLLQSVLIPCFPGGECQCALV